MRNCHFLLTLLKVGGHLKSEYIASKFRLSALKILHHVALDNITPKCMAAGTYECDLIWKQDVHGHSQVQVRAWWAMVGPNPVPGVFVRRGKRGQSPEEAAR